MTTHLTTGQAGERPRTRTLRELVSDYAPSWASIPLLVGMLALIVPTLRRVADVSWSTEQGAHGPIVLAIAIWLFMRQWPTIRAHARPGSAVLGGSVLAAMLVAYLIMRIVGSIVLEAAATYGALLATLYLLAGWRAMRLAWFPLAYFLFVLPPPGSLVALATQPLRLQISHGAVSLLAMLGLPVAQTGLLIVIGQYALEVKAACGGLNSIISLSAIGLFYAYIRHGANIGYLAVLSVLIVGMAILANFIRVILLVLITYYLGNAAAEGFLHQFAGMTMFVVALVGTMVADSALERFRHPARETAR